MESSRQGYSSVYTHKTGSGAKIEKNYPNLSPLISGTMYSEKINTKCPKLNSVNFHHNSDFIFAAASGAYFGNSSLTTRTKSDFSEHPLQALSSPQSERIFFRSLTLSFLKSTVVKSIFLSEKF